MKIQQLKKQEQWEVRFITDTGPQKAPAPNRKEAMKIADQLLENPEVNRIEFARITQQVWRVGL